MKQEIDKAFEGRWRMKGYILENIDGKAAKEIARDFFEAGIMLCGNNCVANPQGVIQIDTDKIPDIIPPNSLFDYWWKLYDLKVGKEKCIKKWERLTEKEKSECISATPAYVASTPDKQYRKRPLTYLNGKCWNDEIIIKNGTKQSTDKQQQQLSKLADILTD